MAVDDNRISMDMTLATDLNALRAKARHEAVLARKYPGFDHWHWSRAEKARQIREAINEDVLNPYS